MARVNEDGYVEVSTSTNTGRWKEGKTTFKDWWLVKDNGGTAPQLSIRKITLPRRLIGKRVTLKIEVLP